MPRFPGIHRMFRSREISSVEREVDDELSFHFAMRVQELIAKGLTPEAANAEAERAFGDVALVRASLQRMGREVRGRERRAEWWADTVRDVRLALRGIRRQPMFALTVVLTLALGIGANIAMFGIVDRLLLRPPAHLRAPDLLRRLYFTITSDGEETTQPHMSYPQFLVMRESMRSAAGVAAFYSPELTLGEGDAARPQPTMLVTANFFSTLGVRLVLGRSFTDEEDTPPAGARVAVISYELWQREYGGERQVIGNPVTIAGDRYEIIGVAPRGFTGVDLKRIEVWVPLSAAASKIINSRYVPEPWNQAKNIEWLRGIARVNEPATIARTTSEATGGFRRALEATLSTARVDSMRPRAALEPLLLERGPDRTPTARIAVWLAGMALVVLLIACANVANLLLARALRRRREIALRLALGAGRGRLVAHLLTEGMLLTLFGGVCAVFIAHWGGVLVREIVIPDVAWGDTLVDPRMLLVAGAAVLLTWTLTSLVPALQASDIELAGALKTGAREGGGKRSRTRNVLVVAQAALSLVLLVGAGLFLRSLHNARSVDLGFSADKVLTVEANFAAAGYSNEESLALYERLLERMGSLPGVQHASLGVTIPFSTLLNVGIRLPGRDSVRLPPTGPPRINAVTADYFPTLGTPIRQGRGFTERDRRGATPVTVVNEMMARTLWPGQNPLGQCVIITESEGEPCLEVVGIAADVRWNDLQEHPAMQMYVAMAQRVWDSPLRVVYLRTTEDGTALAHAARREVREMVPSILFADVNSLAQNIEPSMRPWRLGATMFTVFGALALVLAALGLYSVIAYDVAQRMHEMGIRIVLGARSADVLLLVVGQGVRVAGLGIALGAIIVLFTGRWIRSLLFEISPRDPVVIAAMTLTLLLVAVAASLIPAWRATRVHPSEALRAD
ncbi:MAG: ABC transporter permease [Anaerolineae bacterium]|nr:ABC transporter permease [Gemmatimonadaceae bacterium]